MDGHWLEKLESSKRDQNMNTNHHFLFPILLLTFWHCFDTVASQVLRTGVHEIPFRFALPDSR